MSLKDLQLVYDMELNKWVYKDKDDETVQFSNKRIIANRYLRNGFYPTEYSFLHKKKMDTVMCSYCGTMIPIREITRDHVYPKSLGGTFTTPACDSCNSLKRDMKPIEWAIEAAASGLTYDMHEMAQRFALMEGKEGEDSFT